MSKPFLNYDEQIDKLMNEKKLHISNIGYAHEMLQRYSYYSLISGYKDEFKDPATGQYKSNASFEDIVALYEFDENLRGLFLKYIQKIEGYIKSSLSFCFCEKYGDRQETYLDCNSYNYVGKNKEDVDKLIRILKRFTTGHTDYRYINHAVEKHGNLPLWVLTNALTFGNISKFYFLSRNEIQAKVAKDFEGINESQLSKLLTVLTQFRNVCAHGERLFRYHTKQAIPDLPLHTKLNLPKPNQEFLYGKHDLFAAVLAMRYLLPNDWFLNI